MENRINIGELDTKVEVLSCVISLDGEGAKTYTFTQHSQPFAKVERRLDEAVANYNLDEGDSVELTMYKIASLDTSWRVKIGSRTYEIVAIDQISRVSPLCIISLKGID